MLTASLARPASLSRDNNLPCQQGRGARRERDSYSRGTGMADQLEQIGPLDWIAAGKHKDGYVHGRNLIDQIALPSPVLSSMG